jgi:hypothetical protein
MGPLDLVNVQVLPAADAGAHLGGISQNFVNSRIPSVRESHDDQVAILAWVFRSFSFLRGAFPCDWGFFFIPRLLA